MTPVAAPADRRFRRAHVKPARRRLHWQALAVPVVRTVIVAALVVYAGYRGAAIVSNARMLQVDRITVRGNDRLSQGEVVALLTGLRGRSLLWTDLEAWRQRLLASPWVRDASLRRSLPSTIEVAVQERLAVGIGRVKGDMLLIDERGQAIDQYGPQYADLDLPIIDGLTPAPATADVDIDARADLAMRIITAVRAKPEIARRLSQIDVTDVHDATVILSGDPAVLHLGDEQFLPRLESYLQLAPTLRERVAEIDYVDLRFDDRIYVKPVRVQGSGFRVQGSGLRVQGARLGVEGSRSGSGQPSRTGPRPKR